MEENQNIENLRNQLNLEIISVLTVMDMIDLKKKNYDNYIKNSLNEEEFLKKQIELVQDLKNRLVNIFKD